MHVVQVANFYGPHSGGLRTTMQELGRGYQARGHQATLIVPGEYHDDEQTPWGRRITIAASRVPGAGGCRIISDLDRLVAILDEIKPDRLEVSDRTTLRCLGWWAAASGVPAFMWAHERVDGVLSAFLPGPWPSRFMADVWNRSTVRRFERVVCTTEFAAAEFDRIGWRGVTHVPLGVDLDMFNPQLRDEQFRSELLGPGIDTLVVLCSRLSKEKRPMDAFDTLSALRRRGVRARLVVMGTGPLDAKLRKLARRLPVTMLGHCSERAQVARVLAAADVVLSPGPIETFGLAALESLASGTPVVACQSSAVGEVIAGGGGIVSPPCPEHYADSVLAVLAEPESVRRAAARKRAEEFPWSRTVDALLSLHGASGCSVADDLRRVG